MPSNFTYYIKTQCTLDTYSSTLSLLPFELFSQQCVGWRMVLLVGIYSEAMKGGILGGDTNSTARSRHWQLMVRGTPRHVTSSRLSWAWSLSPNPLVHPLPVAASPSLEVFLRNTHLSLPSHLCPGSFPGKSEEDGHVTRPPLHRGAGPGIQWPRSHPLAPSHTRHGARPSGLGHAAQPESSCLTPQALPQPSGGKRAACRTLRGVLGLHLGSPHQPALGLLEKESSVSINNGPFEDEIILGFLSFPRGGNPSLRRYGCRASGKIVKDWTGEA